MPSLLISRFTVSQPVSTPTPGLTFSIVEVNSASVVVMLLVALTISVSRLAISFVEFAISVSKVVISQVDKNPLVYCNSVKKLRLAGIKVIIKNFEKSKGWLARKLSSESQVEMLINSIEEKSIWQKYGF